MAGAELSGLLNTALAIVAIATLAGIGLMRGTNTNLREQLHDADAEIARVKASRSEDQAEHLEYKTDAETKIAELQSENTALRRVVTGEVHWVALGTRLEDAITLLTGIRDYIRRAKD